MRNKGEKNAEMESVSNPLSHPAFDIPHSEFGYVPISREAR
jgi:hypothetical protein